MRTIVATSGTKSIKKHVKDYEYLSNATPSEIYPNVTIGNIEDKLRMFCSGGEFLSVAQ